MLSRPLADAIGLLVIAAALVGCRSGEETAPLVPVACQSGEWRRDDGACIPAGLPPDMPCPPGEQPRDDGTCIPAGVPLDGCSPGFVHDGDRGCDPVLPAAPCGSGLMAVPGESRCREVAPCGEGTWGDIPVEPGTQYVDQSYVGPSDGTADRPWTTIQDAVAAAASGAMVALAAGSYAESVVISGKAAKLRGRCPALVTVSGTTRATSTISVEAGASGTELRDLAITGPAVGATVAGAQQVLFDRVRVHDTGMGAIRIVGAGGVTLRGVLIERPGGVGVESLGSDLLMEASAVRQAAGAGVAVAHQGSAVSSSLELRASFVERNRDFGVRVDGSVVLVQASVVGDTAQDAAGLNGSGIGIFDDPAWDKRGSGVLDGSVIIGNHLYGVWTVGSDVEVTNTVITDTKPDATGLGAGVGAFQRQSTEAPAQVMVARSLIDRMHNLGMYVTGSGMTIEASVIRDTFPDSRPEFGAGLGLVAVSDPVTNEPSQLVVHASAFERTYETGIRIVGSQAVIETTVVRDTMPGATDNNAAGILVDSFAPAPRSSLELRESLIEQSHKGGLWIQSSDAVIEHSVVRTTWAEGKGPSGHGVTIWGSGPDERSNATIRGLLVEDSRELGIAVINADALIESSVVRMTSSDARGAFGDGIMGWSLLAPTHTVVTATRVEQSARAAISNFGATVSVMGAVLECQSFDLNGESWQGAPFRFDDLGGNACGCPQATGECRGVSSNLAPPPPPHAGE